MSIPIRVRAVWREFWASMTGLDIYLLCGGVFLGLMVLVGLLWFLWVCLADWREKRRAKKREKQWEAEKDMKNAEENNS